MEKGTDEKRETGDVWGPNDLDEKQERDKGTFEKYPKRAWSSISAPESDERGKGNAMRERMIRGMSFALPPLLLCLI